MNQINNTTQTEPIHYRRHLLVRESVEIKGHLSVSSSSLNKRFATFRARFMFSDRVNNYCAIGVISSAQHYSSPYNDKLSKHNLPNSSFIWLERALFCKRSLIGFHPFESPVCRINVLSLIFTEQTIPRFTRHHLGLCNA